MRKIAQEVTKAVAEQGRAARDILKAAQSTTKLAVQVRKASGEQAQQRRRKSRRPPNRCAAARRRRRARWPSRRSASSEIASAAVGMTRTIGDGQQGDDRTGDRDRADYQGRRDACGCEADQAAKALKEQSRAMKDMTTAAASTAREIKLISTGQPRALAGQRHAPRRGRRDPADHRSQRARREGHARQYRRSAAPRRSAQRRSSSRVRGARAPTAAARANGR